MTITTRTEVLIVGAGPAGLIAARALTLLGIDIKIIDKRLPGELAGQADGVQPRTIEIWDSLGMGDALRKVGKNVHRFVTYGPRDDGTGVQKVTDVANIPLSTARYPHEVLAAIQDIEGTVVKALQSDNVRIDQPAVPHSLRILDQNEEYPVHVTVHKLDKKRLLSQGISLEDRTKFESIAGCIASTERIQAKYVIGCDGAHSWVRKCLGIPMEGNPTEAEWGVADFTPVTNFPSIRAKAIVHSPSGVIGFLPRPGNTVRIYVQLEPGLKQDPKALITSAVKNGLKPYDISFENITWCNIYRVSQRVAAKFSDDLKRVFIAGDACHVHSPNAGQGANTSMTDAFNLSWKLARVLRGHSDPSILATYEEERRMHSLELIQFDKDLVQAVDRSVDPDQYAQLWKRSILFASGIGVRYTSSLTVPKFQDLAPGIPIGERFPSAEVMCAYDWNTYNTLDFMTFGIRFKLMMFPGDLHKGTSLKAFRDFVAALEDVLAKECIDIFTILDQACLDDSESLPHLITREDRVYLDAKWQATGPTGPEPEDRIYARLAANQASFSVLVRPDGHTSMIIPMIPSEIRGIMSFLSTKH